MTAEEWHTLAAACSFRGVPLTIGPSAYAELVRLRLAHDPLTFADHTADLDGVPLVVDLDQGAPNDNVKVDLCHANFGVGDTYPNPEYDPFNASSDYRRRREEAGDDPELRRRAIRDTAPAMYFTCAKRANGASIYPCTGSADRHGVHMICSCACHATSYDIDHIGAP